MILVDTSVWVRHFREDDVHLGELLSAGQVACHPFVIGELACGDLRNRATILSLLEALPQTPSVEHREALAFVEARTLWGKGLGYVDAHLLASALLEGILLWTHDRRLADVAARLHAKYAIGCGPREMRGKGTS